MDNIFKHRLLLLASFLDTLAPERFSFRHWVDSDWKGKPDLSCGTTACALGWGTTIAELSAAGLTLFRNHRGNGFVGLSGRSKFDSDDLLNPTEEAEEACAVVFDLTPAETEYLFIPVQDHKNVRILKPSVFEKNQEYEDGNIYAVEYNQPSPRGHASAKKVADHIRNFVSKKYPEGTESNG